MFCFMQRTKGKFSTAVLGPLLAYVLRSSCITQRNYNTTMSVPVGSLVIKLSYTSGDNIKKYSISRFLE